MRPTDTHIYIGVRWMFSLNSSFNTVVNPLEKAKEITLPMTFFHQEKGLTLLTQSAFSFQSQCLAEAF